MWRVWVKQQTKYLTLWLARPVLRITFVQYLSAFHRGQKVMSDVISGTFLGPVGPDNRVKFGDPHLNHSREILPEAV